MTPRWLYAMGAYGALTLKGSINWSHGWSSATDQQQRCSQIGEEARETPPRHHIQFIEQVLNYVGVI